MSGGWACGCPEWDRPLNKRRWVVVHRKCNFSAFNGYRRTPSDYSRLQCRGCRRTWRTKARYVDQLKDGRML